MPRNKQVIQYGDLPNHLHILKGADDTLQHHIVYLFLRQGDDLACLVFKQQCAGGRLIKLGDTVEYSGLTITDGSGNVSTDITVKSVDAVGDNWAKMNNEV